MFPIFDSPHSILVSKQFSCTFCKLVSRKIHATSFLIRGSKGSSQILCVISAWTLTPSHETSYKLLAIGYTIGYGSYFNIRSGHIGYK